MFRRRKESWEEWEIEYGSDGFGENGWEERESRGRRITHSELVVFLVLFLYWCFLIVGFFTTDFKDGRGFVVTQELREERKYIDQIEPLYEIIVRFPTIVEDMEHKYSNFIDLTYQLNLLKETLLHMQKEQKKITPPGIYEAFHRYLLDLSDETVIYIQDMVEYYQAPNEIYRTEMVEKLVDLNSKISNLKEQMKDIKDRLTRNQRTT